ncbi:IS3 family transposase [Nocardiopsis sp. CC223A]|uniref:IS3 family transposase n=1 Tax=Nocardiopsis sp. CC223A TaxID=3044051 RepID=UPI00278BCCEB|nr:IS3 family transposase [Nocardiopsis sp. CC223A]
MARRKPYSQEFKDEAVRMVLDGPRPIIHVAKELGIHDTTLGNWVAAYKREHGQLPSEQDPGNSARELELKRENRKLREQNAFLKKSSGLLRGRESMTARYELIDAEKDTYAITDMCAWLDVSQSGYYDWRNRPEPASEKRRDRLRSVITAVFDANHETYGYRRVHAVLRRSGERAGPELVRRFMRDLGLHACQPRPWRPATTDADRHHRIPDLIDRDFTAERPGAKFVGDVTYIPTWEGFLYLATVIDCHTKKVVGWSMGENYKTPLVKAALEMTATNTEIEMGEVFHSDRGSNYTSLDFAAKLESMGMRQSVGRTGVCWDNAMAESFFGALKNEWLNRFEFTSRAKARREVVKYIEGFHNRLRLHSGLGYRTPQDVEDGYLIYRLAA